MTKLNWTLAIKSVLLLLLLSIFAPVPTHAFFGRDTYCRPVATWDDWYSSAEAKMFMKMYGWSESELRAYWEKYYVSGPSIDKTKGDPVALASGQERRYEVDIAVNSRGISTEIIRYYNNRAFYDGPLGPGWSLGLDHQVFVLGTSGEQIALVRMGNGDSFRFYQDGEGNYTPDDGNYDTLTTNGDNFILRKKNGTVYVFAKLTVNVNQIQYNVYPIGTIADTNGNTQHFIYDLNARLVLLSDTAGRQYSFSYNTKGKLVSINDPLNRTYTYAYDETGHLSSYTNPSGNSRQYAYDANGYLSQTTDFMGNPVVNNTYDHYGRVTNQQFNGGTLLFEYATGKTTYTDQNSNVWTYEHDEAGNMQREVDPEGNAKTQEYDLKNNRIARTDKTEHRTTYTYDTRGNILTETDPLGQVTTYTYEPFFDKVAAITNPMQVRTEFHYDSAGNLLEKVEDVGGLNERHTLHEVDGYGQVTKVTDPDGRIVSMAYDSYGNLATLTDGNNAVTQFTNDVMGRLLAIETPLGAISTSTYDNGDNLLTITDPLNHTTTMSYNMNGHLLTSTDPNSNVTTKVNNIYGQLIETVNAMNHSTGLSYDITGELAQVVDANNHATTYTRDALSRIKEELYQNGSKLQYSYDLDGRLVSLTDQAGSITTFAWDELGRLTGKSRPGGPSGAYSYDAEGRLLSATDGAITVSYTYDSLGRVTQERTQSPADGMDKSIVFSYDMTGNLTQMTYPDGSLVFFLYDDAGRLSRINDQAGNAIGLFSYDSSGRRTWLGLLNGVSTSYNYDIAGRLIGLETVNASLTRVADFQYILDNVGNRTSMTTQDGQYSFGYDLTYQLTNATYPGGSSVGYVYDSVGNRVQVSDNGTTIPYTNDDMNRLLTVNGIGINYDVRGNLTYDGTNTYYYDHENHLIRADTLTGSIMYTYDPLGRLFSRTDMFGTKYFIHAGQQIMAEYGSTGSLQAKYVYGTGIDEPLEMERNGQKYYYSLDGLGSVAALTNTSGQVVESYNYDVYGKPNAPSSIGNPYLFTGRQYDAATGVYYYRERWYAPVVGRFTAKDPIGFDGGDTNLYAYVTNDPINLTDPLGLYWFRQPWQTPGVVGRRDTPVPPRGRVSEFIEKYVPAGYTFGEMHDNFVGVATSGGISDWIANVPSMLSMYGMAVSKELLRTNWIIDQPTQPTQCK